MRLARRIAERIGLAAVVCTAVAALTFVLLTLSSGDAAARLDDPRIPDSARAAIREQLDLNAPVPERLARYVARLAGGDLGWSVARGEPVRTAIARSLGPSLLLGLTGATLGVLLAVLVGTWQASVAGSTGDRWLTRTSAVLGAVPDFWLALLGLAVVAQGLHAAPTGGWRDVAASRHGPAAWLDVARHLVLPASIVALIVYARVVRYQRAAVRTALMAPFTSAARARGLSATRVLWRHAVPSAAAPVIALTGLLVPGVIAGLVFVERVFSWPGVGRLLLDAVAARDVPLTSGIALLTSLAVVSGSLVSDLLHAVIDPRVRDA
ncbi:MAG: ABC transporter permease [Gemmatimonadaceae bacterium]|nr:ABC transporter permease [Gemmatimonadaceae bacterium]